MERFVQLVVAGGVALVAGLWILAVAGSGLSPLGGVLALTGAGALAVGIGTGLDQ